MCNGTSFTVEKMSPLAGLELRTARSIGQSLTHSATGAPHTDDCTVMSDDLNFQQ